MSILRIDGVDYDSAQLSEAEKAQLAALQHADAQIRELTNMKALLTRAKNSYVEELKREIIKGKSGVDLGALFSD
jgi:hypothetical protein